jgi:hypothetical protein
MTTTDLVLAMAIPLLVAELGPWCGWLSAKLLPWSAVFRYGSGERADIRAEEWNSDLNDIPGQLTKLAYSLGQLLAGSAIAVRRNVKRKMLGRIVAKEEIAKTDLLLVFLLGCALVLNDPKIRDRWSEQFDSDLAFVQHDGNPSAGRRYFRRVEYSLSNLLFAYRLRRQLRAQKTPIEEGRSVRLGSKRGRR